MASDAAAGEGVVLSAATVAPAGLAEVGGDFQLVRAVGSKTVALVGDVAGNGRDAAPYADRLCGQLEQAVALDGATPGLPLGVEESCGATSAERRPLRPGEGMLLFTDGLEDVRGRGGDRSGSARITHTLARQLDGAGPDQVVRTLKQTACRFGDDELPDDLCLVAMRMGLHQPV